MVTSRTSLRRRLVRVALALGIAAALGGCVVVPVGAPGFYRPYHYHYY